MKRTTRKNAGALGPSSAARIVLIDGPELAQLMVQHNCGVRVEETFVLKEVDEDFLDES
jgi:restriction system protein